MTFADKLRELRGIHGYTQAEAAEGIGVSTRTYKNYELGHTCPRTRQIYTQIADFYSIDLAVLLNLGNRFISESNPKQDLSVEEAQEAVQRVVMMFAGGSLSEQDKDLALQAIFKAYWDAKQDNN